MLGELLSLACAFVWGVSVVLFRRSEAVSAQAINLFKNVAGAVLLGATLLVMGEGIPRDRAAEDWVRLLVSGVIGISIADTLFLVALRRIGAAMLAIVDCVYAPLVVLFSVLLLGERLSRGFLAGASLVFVGLVVVSVSPASLRAAKAEGRHDLEGVALAFVSILLMAVGLVIAKPVLARSGVVEVTFTRIAAGALALALGLGVTRRGREAFGVLKPQPVWSRLVPASVLGTYIAMLLWLGGMKYTSASTASVLNQLSVVFTLLLAWAVLREPMTGRRVVGGALSLAGAMVVLWGSAGSP